MKHLLVYLLTFLTFNVYAGNEFITTWQIDEAGENITIPTTGSGYHYDVNWGDGSITEEGLTADITHTYADTGTYTIKISGDFPRIYFNNKGDKAKIMTVEQWGNIAWASMEEAFYGCSNLQVNATDAPDLSNVTSLHEMFREAKKLNANLNHWDVSNVKDMSYLFFQATSFNQPLNAWDISKATTINRLFAGATSFNQDLDTWNVSNVQDMEGVFFGAFSFNGNVTNWNTAQVTNMRVLFAGARAFNQDISNWNTSQVTSMSQLFSDASVFNQDIGLWDVSQVKTMSWMFRNAQAFNQDLNEWDVSQVEDMDQLFEQAFAFNGDISTWNTGKVTSMIGMFSKATAFNQDISAWDVSQVEDMSMMFYQATAFNQDISSWNVGNAIYLDGMFLQATKFNQDLSAWDISQVTSLGSMFQHATAFNGDISTWNTSKVNDMEAVFNGASSFNQNLSTWDVSNVEYFDNAFDKTTMSIHNYDSTLIGWSNQTLKPDLIFGAAGLVYCNATTARQSLINDLGWTFKGDSLDCNLTTWDGTSWDSGSPYDSISVSLKGNYDTDIQGSFSCKNLRVNTGDSLIISSDNSIVIYGNLVNLGVIIVKDMASFVQVRDAPCNIGNGVYAVEQAYTNSMDQQNFWSSPVQQTSSLDVFNSNGTTYQYFEAATQQWIDMDSTASLSAGFGFTVTGTSTSAEGAFAVFADHTGFNSGTITQELLHTDTVHLDSNRYLVGNPYPSGIDLNLFFSDNPEIIEEAAYLWNSNNSDYAVMNLAGVANGGNNIAPTSTTISSCQSFFVQSKASGELTFSNRQRVGTNNTFQRVQNFSGERIWLGVTNTDNGVKNEILLAFSSNGEWEDDRYDAEKLSGNEHLAFYSLPACRATKSCDSTPGLLTAQYIIQGLPMINSEDEIIIPLGLEVQTAGEYNFSINHLNNFSAERHLYLYDSLTGEYVDLQIKGYELSLAEGTHEERFYLVVTSNQITSLTTHEKELGMNTYAYQDQIYIQFTDQASAQAGIGIYDITGKLIHQQLSKHQLGFSIPINQSGIYIVKIENKFGVLSRRVFIE